MTKAICLFFTFGKIPQILMHERNTKYVGTALKEKHCRKRHAKLEGQVSKFENFNGIVLCKDFESFEIIQLCYSAPLCALPV